MMDEILTQTLNIEDLTGDTNNFVVHYCSAIVDSGHYVLHGSNVKPVLHLLEPRQANDAAKRSGNQFAVYASLDTKDVLMHAILNREYLAHRLKSYTIGYRRIAGRSLYKATHNLYRLFLDHDPDLCSDGFVYVMGKASFICSNDSDSEFFSLQPLTPIKVLKVSALLRNILFKTNMSDGTDTIIPYSFEEMMILADRQVLLESHDGESFYDRKSTSHNNAHAHRTSRVDRV
jgi:hypothetical protein